jgi:hypothetical protein
MVVPAIMAGVEEVEVVVAHNERATLRVRPGLGPS